MCWGKEEEREGDGARGVGMDTCVAGLWGNNRRGHVRDASVEERVRWIKEKKKGFLAVSFVFYFYFCFKKIGSCFVNVFLLIMVIWIFFVLIYFIINSPLQFLYHVVGTYDDREPLFVGAEGQQ